MPQRRALALLLALVVLLTDQLSKNWLLHQPGAAQGLPLLPGLMNLRLVWNNGAAFSLFREGAPWLGVISLVVSVGLLVWLWRRGNHWHWLQLAAAGFLLGGSAGNGIDRWLHGAVVDGLELVPFSFPVFNLADVAINLAVLCLLLDGLRSVR